MTSPLFGMRVVINDALPDGTVAIVGNEVVAIGAFPRTEVELAGYHARWLVQQGLIDVLHWLGEKPIPKHPPTANGVLAALRGRP
jgi:hypothetical protein